LARGGIWDPSKVANSPPPGKTANKQFTAEVHKLLPSNAGAAPEFPLQMLRTWFQDLPLKEKISKNLAIQVGNLVPQKCSDKQS
jgi:hypothetical protein